MSGGASTPIWTPDRRLRVFVSGAVAELAQERRAAKEAIETLRLHPILVDEGARPHAPRELVRAYLEGSHVFVGIYGARYGPPAHEGGISTVHDEYLRAAGLPRLLYVRNESAGRDPALDALIRTFEGDDQASYARFDDPDELRALLLADLAALLTERFTVGGDEARAASVDGRPMLPVPGTRLVGRERELGELRDLTTRHRLVTITGPGGVGKTRVALAVARSVDPETEGPWFVDLSGIDRGDLVLRAVEEGIGVLSQPDRSGVDGLAGVIGGRRMLLVLDNCEQVVDDAAALVATLLARCPALRVLCTSRQPLHIQGERLYTLSTLPIATIRPDGGIGPGDAMRLLEARARDLDPGFRLDDANAEVIRAICAELDGLPLAIELAAARLRLLTPEGLAARLDARFGLLAGGPRDRPDRQRTLAATIDWSYTLLTPDEQHLLRELSAFRGGFELDAVVGVTGIDDLAVVDTLAALVEKSLVTLDPGAAGRYRMLTSLREYAAWRLPDEGRRDLAARHLRWLSDLCADLGPKLFGPDAPDGFERLVRERDNVRAALTFALEEGAHDVALGIVGDLAWFWYRRGEVAEGRAWIEAALEAAGDAPHPKRALSLVGLAGLHYLHGELPRAAELCFAGQAEAERVGDVPTLGRALTYAAYFVAFSGDLARAEALATQARDLGVAHGIPVVRAEAAMALGQLHRLAGEPDEAERVLHEAAEVARLHGNRWLEGSALWIAAKLDLDVGNVERSLERLRYILRLHAAESDVTSTLVGLLTAAATLTAAGLPERGAMLLGAVDAIGGRIGYHPERMDAIDGPRAIASVRASLDEEAFERAFAEGARLGLDDARALVGFERAKATVAVAPVA